MSDVVDRCFLRPRGMFTARQVNAWDAVNLVAYAKAPLVTARRGADLVAGFLSCEQLETPALMTLSLRDRILSRYPAHLAAIRYPVAPSQYESLLEEMLQNGESALPFFFHEHHLLVDRRRRANVFLQAYGRLVEDVRVGNVVLQRTESERASHFTADAWMTAETFAAYLERSGVAPWWQDPKNADSHERLERVLLSHALKVPDPEISEQYDPEQLPSRLFASMLIAQIVRARGYSGLSLQKSMSNTVPDAQSAEPPSSSANATAGPSSREASTSEKAGDPVRSNPNCDSPSELPVAQSPPMQLVQPTGRLGEQRETRGTSVSAIQDNETLLSKKEVASLLGISINTVDNYRKDKPDFPEHLQFGPQTIRWRHAEIIEWRDRQGAVKGGKNGGT